MQVGKGSSATDLAMRNSTARIAAHHADVSTMQRATPRMVCVYFLNILFLTYSGSGNSWFSVIHHHT
jgi:preprotein translocase subunit SecG